MIEPAISSPRASLLLPDSPALVAGAGRVAMLTTDGEMLDLAPDAAMARLAGEAPPLLVHAPAAVRRLGVRTLPCLDLLELFAFVHPARAATPTPRGLAMALGMALPRPGAENAVAVLPDLVTAMLAHLAAGRELPSNRDAAGLAARMGVAGWLWAPFVLAALGAPDAPPAADALRVWKRLPEWEETGPPPPPASHPVEAFEARQRLASMLGPNAEQRPGQADYAAAAAHAFAPRASRGDPHLVLAEAGTGTGKTLGYIAAASLWAERNAAAVWLSTFTRHLQRQIDTELTRLFPDPVERQRRVVVRKGRENYLCLLNYEDAVSAAGSRAGTAAPAIVAYGLIARWAAATKDGDIQGGDLPGWFAELFGHGLIASLADRRGECIHGACPHWKRCFVEHTIRRAKGADLVIANHALVMAQAAHSISHGGGLDDATVPVRYVFDEGHHVFDAADGAFSVALSGMEAGELRRWLLGAEGARSRARGMRERLDGIILAFPDLSPQLDAALTAARALPAPGWPARLTQKRDDAAAIETVEDQRGPTYPPGGPTYPSGGLSNPTETFLRAIRAQALARAGADDGQSWLECDLHPVNPEVAAAAGALRRALVRLVEPLQAFTDRLADELTKDAALKPKPPRPGHGDAGGEAGGADGADEDDQKLDDAMRSRIEGACRAIRGRALDRLRAWVAMLGTVASEPPEPGTRPVFVDFLRLERRDLRAGRGSAAAPDPRDVDAGLHRHWLDPTLPFMRSLAEPAHGLLITSATLRDGGERDADIAWEAAENRVGAPHLPSPAIRIAVASPFDYANQTRAFVVTDVDGRDIATLAAAYRTLFLASGGGALGLFTAIRRLQAVHARIAPELEQAGIPLLAQHVDAMDNATLVDVFRTEEESCLLGTDAMRDGVDVPGRALRLVVFERVPWTRPDILHRERRVHLSGGDTAGFDDRLVRHRLRQAFGRLIRTATDRGVFILLDRRTPTRLLSAFPPGVQVRRLGLDQTVREVRDFLGTAAPAGSAVGGIGNGPSGRAGVP